MTARGLVAPALCALVAVGGGVALADSYVGAKAPTLPRAAQPVVSMPCTLRANGTLRCTLETQGRPVVLIVRAWEDGSARVGVVDPDRRR